MKILKLAALAAVASLGTIGTADAATKNFTECVATMSTEWAGTSVSIGAVFANNGVVIAFQTNRIAYGGGISPLTPAQAATYAPTLNDLRAAAAAGRKVTVYWDDATNTVINFTVHWNQAC